MKIYFSFLRMTKQDCFLVFRCQESKLWCWCTSSVEWNFRIMTFELGKSISWSHLFELHVKKREGLLTTRADIAIWSGKHDKSSAASHIVDFWAILSIDEFKVACLKGGVLKPMLFISIDGGREEAPKSTMTLVGHETTLEILKFILKSIERFAF